MPSATTLYRGRAGLRLCFGIGTQRLCAPARLRRRLSQQASRKRWRRRHRVRRFNPAKRHRLLASCRKVDFLNMRLKDNLGVPTMVAGETERGYRRRKPSGHFRDDPLEYYSFLSELAKRRSESAGSACGTLPGLLAPDFRLCLPQGLFRRRRRRPDTGFFSRGIGR